MPVPQIGPHNPFSGLSDNPPWERSLKKVKVTLEFEGQKPLSITLSDVDFTIKNDLEKDETTGYHRVARKHLFISGDPTEPEGYLKPQAT